VNPSPLNTVIVSGKQAETPVPGRFRSIVRKSALLNVAIVLTSFPVLVYAGGPKAVIPTLEIMAGISVLIWVATFALFSFVTFPRIFRTPVSLVKRRDALNPANETVVADRWLDGPA
jgi:hypothetical protein